ncbi:hypothetical protein T439DRAFT_182194 [Meredithblackwellia eburnea MCA 4105]
MEVELEKIKQILATNDTDKKVHALVQLKQLLAQNENIANIDDDLSIVLGTALHSSNQLLSNAALALLPLYFPRLTTPHQLKHAFVNNLLPIQQLADSKDRVRDPARDALVAAARAALAHSPSTQFHHPPGHHPTAKDKEKEAATPWGYLSKAVQEGAFGSKSPKAREQAIHYLVALRNPSPSTSTTSVATIPPLRPFTPLLLPLLSDADPTVRAVALQATTNLFSHPSVTQAAKADLKKELIKFDVGKKVVDQILAVVLGGAGASASTSLERSSSRGSLGSSSNGLIGSGGALGGAGSDAGSDKSVPISSSPRASMLNATSRSASLSGPSSSSPPSSSTVGANPRPRVTPHSLLSSLPATAFPSDPSSVHTPTNDVQPVYIASPHDLAQEFENMKGAFEGKETEHNWMIRDKNVGILRGMLKGGVWNTEGGVLREGFILGLKAVLEGVLKTASSLRTTIATSALSFITELSETLRNSLDPFLELLLNHCLCMAGQTKKIVATASQACVTALLTHSGYHIKTLQLLLVAMSDKIVSARQFVSGHVLTFVKFHVSKNHKGLVEQTGGLDILAECVRKGLGDANSQVKETSRKTYWMLEEVWPKFMAEKVMGGLDASSKKQLEKAKAPPASSASGAAGSSTPGRAPAAKVARPSVRAMIAQAKAAPQPKEPQTEFLPESPAPPLASPSTPAATGSIGLGTPRARINTTPRPRPPSIHSKIPTPTKSGSSVTSSPPVASPTTPKFIPPLHPTSSHKGAPLFSPTPGTVERAVQAPLPPPTADESMDLMHLSSPFLGQGLDDSDEDAGDELDAASRKRSLALHAQGLHGVGSSSSLSTTTSTSSAAQSPVIPRNGVRNSSLVLPVPEKVVDAALKDQADQAEQAAQRLLELAAESESEVESGDTSLRSVVADDGMKAREVEREKTPLPLRTPIAARSIPKDVFEDSPDVLRDPGYSALGNGSGKGNWWTKKVESQSSNEDLPPDTVERKEQITALVTAIYTEQSTVEGIRTLSALSKERPWREDDDDESRSAAFWEGGRTFSKVFEGLKKLLLHGERDMRKDCGLILFKDLVGNQFPGFVGDEMEVFTLFFQLREDGSRTTIAAVDAIADLFCIQTEPLYGLGSLRSSMSAYLASQREEGLPKSYALGLRLLGKLFERLPSEILEDELPKTKELIKVGLKDKSGDNRRAAIHTLVAAQSVLQDEERLSLMMDGLAPDQRNLLAYYLERAGQNRLV